MDSGLVERIDELVAAGIVASRSEAVRLGLETLLDQHRRATTGAAIVQGYLRQPQSETEVGWADQATTRMIAEEPW